MIAEIGRLEESEQGTIGALKLDKQVFCWTLEPPDKDNASNISNIPAQQYRCKRYSSSRYKDTFEVTNVPGRSYILFHAGNTIDHTQGCILLGETIGKLQGNRAVLNSGKTFGKFMAKLHGLTEFHLTIGGVLLMGKKQSNSKPPGVIKPSPPPPPPKVDNFTIFLRDGTELKYEKDAPCDQCPTLRARIVELENIIIKSGNELLKFCAGLKAGNPSLDKK